ncbi:TPA: O-antigen ligase family protein [Klebsiella aerogenes]|uniref:O-antigen ligase family protein n=1 Tax=Klebsiella TaxID=570 RepID=UPI001BD32F45|nr:O-antigen ligase family protein [Klebsiella aerogenes]EKV8807364.1 O-antigen ligase family protein [Klebsiella aerogenes]ELJ2005409.1 O-antigen ligase family protein [Klebsiella aerogenes]MDT8883328.1 O-antigen ligase family protein [Klebsiella aerogenes]HCM6939680.1 O-antigen ligase family protein [Klebsiella aerogenes]HCM7227238.1 O-antigen ligase family protein [Klebsiella aerogenes]
MIVNKNRVIAFVCTLLVSVDVIQVSGLRLTLLPLLAYGLYLLLRSMKIDKWFFYVLIFALTCLPSVFFSTNEGKSLGYLIWIIFNYISISIVYKHLITNNKDNALVGIRDAYRFQIIIGALLTFSGIQYRAQVLYYEPSYFALSLTPYVVMIVSSITAIGKNKNLINYTGKIDWFLIAIALYTTKSANLIFVFLISIIILSMIGKGKFKKTLLMSLVVLFIFGIFYFYSQGKDDLLSTTFQNFINSSNKFNAAMDRTGNRWPRAQLTYDIAMSTFWGIGIGAFEEYTLSHFLPMYSGLTDYLSPIGYPAINIYFEIAATCGWLALVVWLFWHYKMLSEASKNKSDNPVIICSLIVAMLALFIESNFMRPYYWMLIGLVMGQISLNKRNSNNKI